VRVFNKVVILNNIEDIVKLRLFYSMKQKTLLLLLSALFIIHPIKLFGQQDQKDHFLKIEIKNNRISIDAKNAPLPEVLKKIEKDTGVKMTLHKAADGKRVTAQFKNLDIENALRKILGDNYAFVFSKDKVESALPPKDPQGHYIVAVHRIGKDGSYLGAIVMPENKDPINMEKEYAIGGDGTVYYFVPAYDKARMFIFPPQ
jgi:hypothetical protein